MPVTAPQWTEVLYCPLCYKMYNSVHIQPISLGCGHTVCRPCLGKLHQRKCPFDQFQITRADNELSVNSALLCLVGDECDVIDTLEGVDLAGNEDHYLAAMQCVVELAVYLKPMSMVNKLSPWSLSPSNLTNSSNGMLSRPMQRKLVTLICCQLMEEEGVSRALRAARSLGERTVTELILQNQNQQQLSANLWAAVRSRGCQFLGPAMQEEVLKLILLVLEDGSSLSRKVLVLYVVQKLEGVFSQASKTAIGHVVQLLYRASCFKVAKRDGESSLMELKEDFRTYEQLRREHDSQIVQIATEAGLRIAPDQWSSLLYGDTSHKSHMQSIIDKLQTPESFSQSISELMFSLQRSKQAVNTTRLSTHLERLTKIDMNPDAPPASWKMLAKALVSARVAVDTLMSIISSHIPKKADVQAVHNAKYKTSMCRDHAKGNCPRSNQCTFAHSSEELERFRARSKKYSTPHRPAITTPKARVEPITTGPSDSHGSEPTNSLTSDSEEFARNMAAVPPRMMTYELPYSSSKGRPMYPAQGYQLHHAPKGNPEQSMFQRPTTPDSALKGLRQRRNNILAKLNKSLPGGEPGGDVTLDGPFNPEDAVDYSPGASAPEGVYYPWLSGYFEPPIKAVVTPVVPRMMTEPTYTTNRVRNTSAGRNRTEFVDPFVPFDPPIVSKYGPIKKLKDTAKFKLTEPVQAVSSQPKPTVPVTAITPTTRPFPSPSPVPSMYTCIQGQPEDIVMDPHTGEPIPGNKIAHVVRVAQLQFTSPLAESTTTPRPDPSRHVTSIAEREQLKLELNQVNQKIDKLAEYSQLTQELQWVERSIFETEQKQVSHADVYTGHTNLSILNEGHRFPSVADIGLDVSSCKTVNVMPNPGMYTQMPAPVPPSALSNTVYWDPAAVPRGALPNTIYRESTAVPPSVLPNTFYRDPPPM